MSDFCPEHGTHMSMCYECATEELKEQIAVLHKVINNQDKLIQDMKCCGNCKHVDVHLCGLNLDQITPEFCCAKWELLE